MLSFLALNFAQKAVSEKIEDHLIDKANDTAEIIDSRINAFFQLLNSIAREQELTSASSSDAEKLEYLDSELALHNELVQLNFYNTDGFRYTREGKKITVSDRDWFQSALKGKPFASEPLISRSLNKLLIIFAVPVYSNGNIVGVLNSTVDGLWLCDQIADIVVGKTGACYIVGLSGTTIADEETEIVKNKKTAEKMQKPIRNLNQ